MKMGFLQTMELAWPAEELKKWKSMKKAVYLLLPLFLYYVVHDLAQIVLWGGLELMLSGNGGALKEWLIQNGQTANGMVSGIAILLGMLPIWSMLKKEALPVWKKKGNVTSYGVLAAIALCVSMGVNILFFQMGITESSAAYTRVEEAQYGVAFAIGLILYGVISPIAEEAVFRGIIYNRMKRCFSVKLAVPLSALLFGLYHGNTVQALYGFLLGVIIAIVYERSESFAAPVIFHAVANVTVFTVTYRNGLRDLNSAVAIGLAVALLIFAAGLGVWYLKLCEMGENKQITNK